MSELLAVLQHRTFARATAAMSSYVRRGATFWLPTAAGSVRERNLRDTPWLTMVIAEGDHGEHVAVLIEGSAEVAACLTLQTTCSSSCRQVLLY